MRDLLYERIRGKGGWAAVDRTVGAIVIADGDESGRALAAAALNRAGFETVEVSTGSAVLETVRANGVALVVLEVGLPDMTGYEVCRELRSERGDELPIFFLSGLRTESLDRVAGLLLGADDFIVKPFDPDELVARVRRFVNRKAVARDLSTGDPTGLQLTRREIEILDLLVEGRGQKEIAAQLTISQKTVATHIQNLLGKFGVHSRAELIARAYLLGHARHLSDRTAATAG
jgi:DNA-binding NarL/FixJ family response regulator